MIGRMGRSSLGIQRLPLLAAIAALALLLAAGSALAQAAKGPVDLNTATQKELEGLKGVGAATAKKIIAARPYQSVDELSKAGLTAKQIEAIKPQVTVGGAPPAPAPAAAKEAAKAAATKAAPAAAPAAAAAKEAAKAPAAAKEAGKAKAAAVPKLAPGEKVNINAASKEKIEALPGIGPAKAQAIIAGRPYKAPEDIMKVKGIKQGTFNRIKDVITVQ